METGKLEDDDEDGDDDATSLEEPHATVIKASVSARHAETPDPLLMTSLHPQSTSSPPRPNARPEPCSSRLRRRRICTRSPEP